MNKRTYFLSSNDKEFSSLDTAYMYLNLRGYNDTEIFCNQMVLNEKGENAEY